MTPEVDHKIYSKEIAEKRQILLDGSPEDAPVPALCHIKLREATTAPEGTRLKAELHVHIPHEDRELCVPMPFAMSYGVVVMVGEIDGQEVTQKVQIPSGMTPEFRLEMN